MPKSEIPTTVKNKDLVYKRREQIVLAAIKLFSRKGYFKTTLKDLAEETGLSHGSIYDYVGGKDDIIYLIHDFLAGMAMESIDSISKEIKDPIEKLHRMISVEFRTMDQWSNALLLLFRESYVVKKNYLTQMLSKERSHLTKFEDVLQECIDQGALQNCNIRIASNIIKGMIDSYALKRWDLRGYASAAEFEKFILEMVFKGLSISDDYSQNFQGSKLLIGKSALQVNASTVIGKSICSFLAANGANVAVCTNELKEKREFPEISEEDLENIHFFKLKRNETITPELFNEIESALGTIDIYIQDLGTGNTEVPENQETEEDVPALQSNFLSAHKIANVCFQKEETKRRISKIVYITPWEWDKYVDPLAHEIIEAGTRSLTKKLAEELSPYGINVNCIVPGYIKTIRPSNIQKTLGHECEKEIPLGHLGSISDVINAVQFLVTETSNYITGQSFHVSGGA
ncbi:MAG: SDR family oxidoreductase [Desulfobacteraceae bacterium]|nr:SDR family oxidoreductase [Desulfobacteraceae bacterium]